MGFISYSLNYYGLELRKLESGTASPESVYHARQLLKMLDDLLDEGYTELNDVLEASCQGVSRLRDYLRENNTEPFPAVRNMEPDLCYGQQEREMTEAVNTLIARAQESTAACEDPFIAELIRFCDWVGYEEDTAYVFLLRDTLLPYIRYQHKGRKSIYPWLLGRKTLEALTGQAFVDDEIRAAVIRALESGHCTDFDTFCEMVLPDIRNTLQKYPETEACLSALLRAIGEKRIVVIESGCSGTFPMLLKSLDDRVEVRMYTTYPYLLEIYRDRIYTARYEDNRLFETLYSQDLLFRFSSVKDGHFYVKGCCTEAVRIRSLAEVKAVLD